MNNILKLDYKMNRLMALMTILLSVSAQAKTTKNPTTGFRLLSEHAINTFLSDVEQRLPVSLKDSLQQTIQVTFKPNLSSWPDFRCKNGESDAESFRLSTYNLSAHTENLITLDQNFLKEIQLKSQSQKFRCTNRTLYDLAIGVVVYRLALIYDSTQNISKEKSFLSLVGWRAGKWYSSKYRKAAEEVRTASSTEFSSPSEAFATNLAFSIMDPLFSCRRPAMAEFFHQRFGIVKKSCQINFSVPLTATGEFVDLNPESIREIHYITVPLKNPSKIIRYAFGHVGLRLVVCPSSINLNECRNDWRNNIVINTEANLSGKDFNLKKAVFNEYQSQLKVLRFSDFVRDYVKYKSQNIESYPLALTTDQRARVIYKALELYWEYIGRFHYRKSNCAIDMLDLVQSTMYGRKLINSKLHSPFRVYAQLLRKILIQKETMVMIKPSDISISTTAEERSQEELSAKLDRFLMEPGKQALKAMTPEQRALVEAGQKALRDIQPWSFATDNYGVPLAEEVISQDEIFRRYRHLNELKAEIIKNLPNL